MAEPARPTFEDIATVPDAELQTRLAAAKDFILAAAMLGASAPVQYKLMSNLSFRRREAVAQAMTEAAAAPDRTREVARLALTNLVFGLKTPEIPEIEMPAPKEVIKKMEGEHPDFEEARKARAAAALASTLKRLLKS